MPHPIVSTASAAPESNNTSSSSSTRGAAPSPINPNDAAGEHGEQPQLEQQQPRTPEQNIAEQDGTGCLICGSHDDEDKILLCEQCDGEYHTYCVQLRDIPEDEWYCEKCLSEGKLVDDGLDTQVAALPPSITSQYGQIVWAQGGTNYGWWPAVIYDPRQTVEPARSHARKHLKSKHLCYFYQCEEAPFSILPPKKIKEWLEGLAEDFHLGRAAKSHGKQRFQMFQQAMQVACLEQEKSVHERLDWEHKTTATTMTTAGATSEQYQQLLSPSPNKLVTEALERAKQQQRRQRRGNKRSRSSSTASSSNHYSLSGSGGSYGYNPQQKRGGNRKRSRSHDTLDTTQQQTGVVPEDQELVCTIKYLQAAPKQQQQQQQAPRNNDYSLENDCKHVGFVILKSRKSATFRDARTSIEDELMGDVLPAKLKWHFYVPRLGRVSLKQEASYVLVRFVDTTSRSSTGNSYQNPLSLYLVKDECER